MNGYIDATPNEIETAVQSSWQAFTLYRKMNLKQRADFLRKIAQGLQQQSERLIKKAMQETNLEEPRLKVEYQRTIFQLTSYAQACEEGTWLDIRINTVGSPITNPDGNPQSAISKHPQSLSKVDIRKMLIPLGPVVVFGASNFPFAYSTAGGDTACAFAAGCPVIVKAHPAHAETSEAVAKAILTAAEKCNMPEGVFVHVHGASVEVGKALVTHRHTKAVGFTGSFLGGKQL